MAPAAHERKFWKLLGVASLLAKDGWGLAMLHVVRSRRIAGGKLIQAVSTIRRKSGMRVRMRFSYQSPKPSSMSSFERALKGLGIRRIRIHGGPPRTFRNLASAREIESSLDFVLGGLRSGTFRRPPPRLRSRNWPRARLETLVRYIRQGGPQTWRPGYGCFRTHPRRIPAPGLALQFWCEGLWNDEKDDCLTILVESTRKVGRSEWRRWMQSGFFEGLADEMGRLGLEVSMRARLHGTYVLCEFSRKAGASELLAEAKTLLRWRPPTPFPLRPSKRPPAHLFLDA